MQLHISEKTGRGIPKIVEVYGKEAIDISDDTVLVTIPFNRINKVGDKKKTNITKPELMVKCDLGKTLIDNIISFLRKNNVIERVGSNKTGY